MSAPAIMSLDEVNDLLAKALQLVYTKTRELHFSHTRASGEQAACFQMHAAGPAKTMIEAAQRMRTLYTDVQRLDAALLARKVWDIDATCSQEIQLTAQAMGILK